MKITVSIGYNEQMNKQMNDTPILLSVVMITRNAAFSLARSLNSLLSIADEILLVDSGSDDDTLSIAQSYGVRCLHQDWLGIGPQKQFAVMQACHDWVLCIDSDEWLSDELIDAIQRFKRHPKDHWVFQLNRKNKFMGRFLMHGGNYPDRIIRLFHRQYAKWSDDRVHERVVTSHPIGKMTGDLLHDSAESLDRYLEKQNRYTTTQAEKMVADGKSPSIFQAIGSAFFKFTKDYFFRLGFLNGFSGFVHIFIAASNSFFKYTKAIALIREQKLKNNHQRSEDRGQRTEDRGQ